MNKNAKSLAEMFALGAISAEQVQEYCATPEEYQEALEYAKQYSEQYDRYLAGLEKAAKYHLENEYNYGVFNLGLTPEEALREWDIE